MNSYIILSYILIFGGIVLWAFLLPRGKKVPDRIVENTTVFGGAFLLASCFINLVPHMYINGFSTPDMHIKIGVAVLLGFIIQLLLEHLTNGVEHGHNHCHHCETENGELKTENGERKAENDRTRPQGSERMFLRRTENGERRTTERDHEGANGCSCGELKTENVERPNATTRERTDVLAENGRTRPYGSERVFLRRAENGELKMGVISIR